MTTPSDEITKGYTDTLSFQIFAISMAKFSYFIIFCASVLGRLWVKGTVIAIIIIRLCLMLLSTSKGKGLPQQAEVAQGVPGWLRPRIFLTFGTTTVVSCQPYAPTAFTPGEIPGTHL